MRVRWPTTCVLVCGLLFPTLPWTLRSVPPGPWLELGVVYLVAGVALGGARRRLESGGVSFQYAAVVAATATILALVARVAAPGLTTRPPAELSALPFLLWGADGYITLVVASLTAVGAANGRRQRLGVVAAVVGFALPPVARAVLLDSAYGPAFDLTVYATFLAAGVVLGLPLLLFGRAVRG